MKARGKIKKIPYLREKIQFGGVEESWTPVRKRFKGNFSGRRRLFWDSASLFPSLPAKRQDGKSGSFIMHGALKALRAHVHH
mgnify:CR=1 FL=1